MRLLIRASANGCAGRPWFLTSKSANWRLTARARWTEAYDPAGSNGIDPRNGGIVGTVSYDTTRNELDPQYAAVEDWQPGVSDVPVELYTPVDCGTDPDAPLGHDSRD